jgi:rRNA small subunit pseudouridine methyltransferase Nep1
MLTLVLAEAELEIMPEKLTNHPMVIAHARLRGKPASRILLDSNYHHGAMNSLPDGRRRGRPDITHLFLLTVLESIANKQGRLRIFIHTRNNDRISVLPKTRIMRNYDRFLGLMEQLFERYTVPDEKTPLLVLHQNKTLKQVVDEAHADVVVAFSTNGKPIVLHDYFKALKEHKKKDIVCIIGGFPSGEFHADIKNIASECVSLYPEMLPAWTVASEILVNYENASR